MSNIIKIVTGDTLPDLRFLLTDEITEEPIDLSDVSACLFRIRAVGTTDVLITCSGMPEAPASGGYIRYTWPLASLDDMEAGVYEGEHEITHVSGRVLSVFKTEKIKIRAQFA